MKRRMPRGHINNLTRMGCDFGFIFPNFTHNFLGYTKTIPQPKFSVITCNLHDFIGVVERTSLIGTKLFLSKTALLLLPLAFNRDNNLQYRLSKTSLQAIASPFCQLQNSIFHCRLFYIQFEITQKLDFPIALIKVIIVVTISVQSTVGNSHISVQYGNGMEIINYSHGAPFINEYDFCVYMPGSGHHYYYGQFSQHEMQFPLGLIHGVALEPFNQCCRMSSRFIGCR